MRIGNLFGPDATFVGVPAADLDDEASYAGAAAVIIGGPFDGGTSHRPGTRFGPQAIRFTDYLPMTGAGPTSPWTWTHCSNWAWSTWATSRCRPATPSCLSSGSRRP